ncbi:MAG: hypothetical protein MI924_08630 [Chloroflexales bacterium]|nr:hypothetical protein [Chloroflexales bacterium]
MNYSEIIKSSFNTFWRHKALWVFGIILAFVGKGDFGFSVNYQESFSYPSDPSEIPEIPNPFDNWLFASFFENPLPYIIGFSLLSVIFWIISNFIGWFAHGALIGMVDEIDQVDTTSVRSGWELGKAKVKSLFTLAVVFAIPQLIIFLPAIIIGLVFFFQMFDILGEGFFTGDLPSPEEMEAKFASILPAFFMGFACLFPTIFLGGIISWAIRIVHIMAARSCVLEHLGVRNSVKRGWHITRYNIGYTLLNWLFLTIISGIIGFMAAFPALVLWIPTARAFMRNEWSTMSIISGILVILYFLVVGVLFGGILSSFNSTVWTKLYKGFLAKERATNQPPV